MIEVIWVGGWSAQSQQGEHAERIETVTCCARKFIFISPGEKKKKGEIRVWIITAMKRLGEDLDVGFYSNMKVSLTFSALRWLLILVAFLHTADGKARPVDIYKLIWVRAMAFYKEKHLRMSRNRVLFPLLRVTHERYCFKQTSCDLCSERHVLSHSSL